MRIRNFALMVVPLVLVGCSTNPPPPVPEITRTNHSEPTLSAFEQALEDHGYSNHTENNNLGSLFCTWWNQGETVDDTVTLVLVQTNADPGWVGSVAGAAGLHKCPQHLDAVQEWANS